MLKSNLLKWVSAAGAVALALPATATATATAAQRSDYEVATQLYQAQHQARSPEVQKLVDAMTDMGLELQNSLASQKKNTTTSPYSLMSAWGLVLNGAAGSTQGVIAKALHLPGVSTAEFDQGYRGLSQSFSQISKENVLSFGNAVFADTTFPVRDSYRAQVKQAMGASAENVNFQKPKEASDAINAYIAGKTHDMIQKMVDESSVEGWRVALVNAGYYKGAWAFKFDENYSREDAQFDTGNGTKTVPLMNHYGKSILYYRGHGFQMASLAYKNADFAMDVIVPEKPGEDGGAWNQLPVETGTFDAKAAIANVEAQLTGQSYRAWVAAAAPRRIHLALPRFQTEYKTDLTGYFKAAMPLAFSDFADFTLLSAEPIKIDRVIHATVLKVNEEGTEGAAATVIGAVRATAMGPRPPEVIADRPFVMIVRHVATGTPVFVSTVWDPKPLPKPAH